MLHSKDTPLEPEPSAGQSSSASSSLPSALTRKPSLTPSSTGSTSSCSDRDSNPDLIRSTRTAYFHGAAASASAPVISTSPSSSLTDYHSSPIRRQRMSSPTADKGATAPADTAMPAAPGVASRLPAESPRKAGDRFAGRTVTARDWESTSSSEGFNLGPGDRANQQRRCACVTWRTLRVVDL